MDEQQEQSVVPYVPQSVSLNELVNRTGVVAWRDLREKTRPQGVEVKARELVGRPVTIVRLHPYPSRYEGKRLMVYWTVCVLDETGEVVNTTFGGEVVCEALDEYWNLQEAYHNALAANDEEEERRLSELGGGKYLRVVLVHKDVPGGNGYYTFE